MEFCIRPPTSPYDCVMFDLDDTLYPANTGIALALRQNIQDFLVEKCGFPEAQASHLRVDLFKTHGSTLAGLRALGFDIDAADYHSFVHGRLPYHLIAPDPHLANILRTISQTKVVFTNSDRIHAVRSLDRLGVRECFDQIICFETMNPDLSKSNRPVLLKPAPEAINVAIQTAGVDPHRTLFLDDNVRNIAAGKAAGLRTVLVGKTVKTKDADYAMETVNNLRQAVPEIWDGGDGGMRRSRSELDSMLNPTSVGA